MKALAAALKKAREQEAMTVRELARRASVSHTQVGRIEAGEVGRPSRHVLVALARAMDRNPVPLLILAGHLAGEEARVALEPMFRRGAELPEEWHGVARSLDFEQASQLVRTPGASNRELRKVAEEVFSIAETDETLWDDSYNLVLAQGGAAAEVRELMGILRYIGSARRKDLLMYGRLLRQISDLEYAAEAEVLASEARGSA
jgi:transcriptional regulator with XRE-family HTH domain